MIGCEETSNARVPRVDRQGNKGSRDKKIIDFFKDAQCRRPFPEAAFSRQLPRNDRTQQGFVRIFKEIS
jgi:hypothetical protein